MLRVEQLNEAHLYYILEKAKLTEYFKEFKLVGADDLQQLFEVDDDEFLEIMSLVGMTAKPLHVRRFQKALNAWVDDLNAHKASQQQQNTNNNNITTNGQEHS